MVAKKMVGINIYARYLSACSQLNYAPVMAFGSFTAAFPAIHPLAPIGVFIHNKNAPAWFEQIFLFSKEIV